MAPPILFRLVPACAVLGTLPATIFLANEAHAQASGGDQRIAFDIPAQPLDAALTAYFRATGVQLLYDSALTNGRRSGPVRGNFTPREALRLLLRGTGLIARYSRTNAAILTIPEAREAAPLVPLGRVVVREQAAPPPSRPTAVQRLAFYGQLARELQAHLRGDPRTNRLAFSVRASIEIAPGGRLERVQIEPGQDARTRQLIAEVLTGKTVTPPPDGIAQPLLVALKGKHGTRD